MTTITYKIREEFMKLDTPMRAEVKEYVCKNVPLKSQAFYKRTRNAYIDLPGHELKVWKEALEKVKGSKISMDVIFGFID